MLGKRIALGHFIAGITLLLLVTGVDFLPDWVYATSIQFSSDSRAFDIVFRSERLIYIVGLIVSIQFLLRWRLLRSCSVVQFKVAVLCFLGAVLSLIGPALFIGFVRIDFKVPDVLFAWMTNNLVLVCWVEEMVFRGYVQEGLGRKNLNPNVVLIATALLFGVYHLKGGIPFAVLAFIAGLFYGVAYKRVGLCASTLVHFSVNLAHFLFFSYPSITTSS